MSYKNFFKVVRDTCRVMLMWIKVYHNRNTFIVYNFPILQNLIQKNLKFFGKVKIIKASVGFELMTYRNVDNALTPCTTLLGLGQKIFKTIIDFLLLLISIWSSSQYEGVTYHLKLTIFYLFLTYSSPTYKSAQFKCQRVRMFTEGGRDSN